MSDWFDYYSDVDEHGRLNGRVKESLTEDLMSFCGKRVHIRMGPLRIKRSNQQNRLFHLYCSIMAKELGYDLEEMKDIIKYKFLRRERVVESTGEVLVYLGKTSKLSKLEFAELVDSMVRFAAELNIILKSPEEYFESLNE
jgi:hypothetical protein